MTIKPKPRQPRTAPLARVLVATLMVLLVAAPHGTETATASEPPEVIVDTDVDFDDVAALAYLVQADRLGLIKLRAVTVAVSGFAPASRGLSYTRCVMRKMGAAGVPVSDGDRTGVHPFPALILELIGPIVEKAVQPDPSTACPSVPSEGRAAELLASSVMAASGEVTIVTLGPVTNLAQALEQQPAIAAKIGRVVIEGGATQYSAARSGEESDFDLNIWADVPAVQAVFGALPGRIELSGTNATTHVPLTTAFRERLTADRGTAAAEVVHTIATDPLLMSVEAEQLNPLGLAYWWDPLAAVAATVDGVVTFVETRVRVVQSGPREGFMAVTPDGTAVRFAVWADADRFHDVFLDVLNGRRPRDARPPGVTAAEPTGRAAPVHEDGERLWQ